MATMTAGQMIGWDHGYFKIKNGRTTYQAVMFNCAGRQEKVLLARLDNNLKQTNRYVDWDTILEFNDEQFEEFKIWSANEDLQDMSKAGN